MVSTFRRHIDEHHCQDADDFLQRLRPRLDPHLHGDFIYRGVGDSEKHLLIPSALRPENRFKTDLPAGNVQLLELMTLNEFVAACNRSGLRVPGDDSDLSLNPGHWQQQPWPRTWPPVEHRKLWAVAQHHGVPTRLLDWSRVPTVAAYFAAISCLQLPLERRSEKMAVWALDIRGELIWGEHLAVVRIPAAHSPNLAAQAGLFTVTLAGEPQRPQLPIPTPRSVDEIIRACTFEMGEPKTVPGGPLDGRTRPEVLMQKYTLAREHASDLLELCRAYGVSGATMFPGFDGAAREVKEKQLCLAAYGESAAEKRRVARVQSATSAVPAPTDPSAESQE